MPLKRLVRARKTLGGKGVDVALTGLSRLGKRAPQARRAFRRVSLERNIPYRNTGSRDHLLDVYRPREAHGRLPACLYIHGGGFRILSKETHWMMGLQFALRGGGHVVFNANYRLAPKHPYPAAIEDSAAALAWVQRSAGLTYELVGETLVFTRRPGIQLVVYDLQDLLPVSNDFDEREHAADEIMDLLMETVVPSSWEYSGTSLFIWRDRMAVRQSGAVHEHIAAFLASLRRVTRR